MANIAVIGVGLLGSAVTHRLLGAGHAVTGYDVRPEQLAALASEGLRAAGSIADAVSGAEAVFTILPSLEVAEQVFTGPGGLSETAAKGTAVLQMSTISPELTGKLAKACDEAGLNFVDSPMSGTTSMVVKGDCTIMLGADPALVERVRPICADIAQKVEVVGKVGDACLAKLVINMLVALEAASLAEALVLGAKGGLELGPLVELLCNSAPASRLMRVRGPLMARGDYTPQMKLDLFLKDIRLMLEEGERLGVQLPLTTAANKIYLDAADAGHGEDDLAAIMTTMERMAGIKR